MGDEDLEARLDRFCELFQALYETKVEMAPMPGKVIVASEPYNDLVRAVIDWRGYIVPADRSAILDGTWKDKTPAE
jgi:hypothetical protein